MHDEDSNENTISSVNNFVIQLHKHTRENQDERFIEIQQYYERPNIIDLLETYTSTYYSHIGIFTCGPLSMQDDVRNYVQSYNEVDHLERKTLRLYEEYFEI